MCRLVVPFLAIYVVVLAISYGAVALNVPTWVENLAAAAAAVVVYVAVVRLLEHRAINEVSPRRAVTRITLGVLGGVGLVSLVVGILAVLGVYRVGGPGDGITALGPVLTAAMMAGVTEELVFRGVLLRVLQGWVGTGLALTVSSAVFGLAHLMNPGATPLAVGCVVMAGVLLGAVYLLTRSLWASIALHAAWDVTVPGLWGTPTSGLAFPGLLRGQLVGPAWLTGGEFGLEASLVTLLVLAVAATATLLWARRLHGLTPAPWTRRTAVTSPATPAPTASSAA